MKIYLVGGAVRDKLLGIPVKEKDWVVVGSTPEEMIKLGFRPVGKAFPVFLHPKTNEEYALARTEKKVGKGYKGFTFYTDITITLEEDLARRDLTINAIAEDDNGSLIDPYNGQEHIKQKILHHVSDAFAEDPVRILRVARFTAKLPDFSVSHYTNKLMQHMVSTGEVDALVVERVWQELAKTLPEKQPQRFFETLNSCGALAKFFPEISINLLPTNLGGFTAEQRFALLLQQANLEDIKNICKRLRVPSDFSNAAILTKQLTPIYKELNKENAQGIFDFIKSSDLIRRPSRKTILIPPLVAITGFNHKELIEIAIEAMGSIDIDKIKQSNPSNFPAALKNMQIKNIEAHINK